MATLHDASNFFVARVRAEAQAIFRAAAQRCGALITDSVFARGELARALGITHGALAPIALGVVRRARRCPSRSTSRRSGPLCSTSERRSGARVSTRCSPRWRAIVNGLGLRFVVTTA